MRLAAVSFLTLICLIARPSVAAAHLEIMLTHEVFPSGFQRSSECEDRLDPLMRHSLDEFGEQELRVRVRILHQITDRIFHRALDFMTDPNRPVPSFLRRPHALRAAIMRLNEIADVEPGELVPYAQELLVIANKAGALAPYSLRLPYDIVRGLNRFTRIVSELPTEDIPLNHALRAMADGNLAVYIGKELTVDRAREYAVKGIAHYVTAAIHEDGLGFKQGMITGSIYLVLIQTFEATGRMSPAEKDLVQPHAILWLRAMRAMLNVMLAYGGSTGDYSAFTLSQRQLEHLNMHPRAAEFPALKEEFFRIIAEFRPTERSRN